MTEPATPAATTLAVAEKHRSTSVLLHFSRHVPRAQRRCALGGRMSSRKATSGPGADRRLYRLRASASSASIRVRICSACLDSSFAAASTCFADSPDSPAE